MKIMEWIISLFSERVLFVTMNALCDGRSPSSPFDWRFRNGILDAIVNYKAKRIYFVSNEDMTLQNEEDVTLRYNAIKSVLSSVSRAYVDYMFCMAKEDENPLKMPNIGMFEFFSREHFDSGFDIKRILVVGNKERECAKRIGCGYMEFWDFVKEYAN